MMTPLPPALAAAVLGMGAAVEYALGVGVAAGYERIQMLAGRLRGLLATIEGVEVQGAYSRPRLSSACSRSSRGRRGRASTAARCRPLALARLCCT